MRNITRLLRIIPREGDGKGEGEAAGDGDGEGVGAELFVTTKTAKNP